MKAILKSESGSPISAAGNEGTGTANNSEPLKTIKVCKPALPWLCRDCEMTPASCGKSIRQCEDALYRANEYERGGCRV